MIKKTRVNVKGVDMGTLAKGKPCVVLIGEKWYSTSDVVQYFVGGGRVYIETQHAIYAN